jgi:hypothetical protein
MASISKFTSCVALKMNYGQTTFGVVGEGPQDFRDLCLDAAQRGDSDTLAKVLAGATILKNYKPEPLLDTLLEFILEDTKNPKRFEQANLLAQTMGVYGLQTQFSMVCEAVCEEQAILTHCQKVEKRGYTSSDALMKESDTCKERMKNLFGLVKEFNAKEPNLKVKFGYPVFFQEFSSFAKEQGREGLMNLLADAARLSALFPTSVAQAKAEKEKDVAHRPVESRDVFTRLLSDSLARQARGEKPECDERKKS